MHVYIVLMQAISWRSFPLGLQPQWHNPIRSEETRQAPPLKRKAAPRLPGDLRLKTIHSLPLWVSVLGRGCLLGTSVIRNLKFVDSSSELIHLYTIKDNQKNTCARGYKGELF